MAHIEERGNSVRIRIDCGYDSNGKRNVKSKTIKIPDGTPKRERARIIQAACDEFERKVKGGSSVANDKLKFKDFALGMYEKNHLSTLKPKTADGYRLVIRYRLIDYFGEMLLQDITPLDVRKWLSQLDRINGDKQLSENSKGNWYRTLSAIMGKAEEWELIEANPCKKVKQPRKPQSDVRALSQEDAIKVCSEFANYDDLRIVTLMKVLILTGMRSSECAGLEWRDVNFEDSSIRIERETIRLDGKGFVETPPKSASSRRVIAIPEELCEALRAYRDFQDKEIEARGDLWIGEKGERCKLFTRFDGKPVANSTIRFGLRNTSIGVMCLMCRLMACAIHSHRSSSPMVWMQEQQQHKWGIVKHHWFITHMQILKISQKGKQPIYWVISFLKNPPMNRARRIKRESMGERWLHPSIFKE